MNRERRASLYAQFERAVEIPMLALSLLFLLLVLVQETAALDPIAELTVEILIGIIWGVFAAELALKFYLAPERRAFLRTHWADVVIVAVPFLRPLRLLRVVLISARALRQFRQILRSHTFSLVGMGSLTMVILSSVLVYVVEQPTDSPIENYGDALWWAASTITTVGYGDMYPVTGLGRGIAVFLMLTGIALFGLLTANVAAFFVDEDKQAAEASELTQVMDRLTQIEQQLAAQAQPRRLPRLRAYRPRSRH